MVSLLGGLREGRLSGAPTIRLPTWGRLEPRTPAETPEPRAAGAPFTPLRGCPPRRKDHWLVRALAHRWQRPRLPWSWMDQRMRNPLALGGVNSPCIDPAKEANSAGTRSEAAHLGVHRGHRPPPRHWPATPEELRAVSPRGGRRRARSRSSS